MKIRDCVRSSVATRQDEISDVSFAASGVCIYPRSPAFALGIVAAISIMIAEVIISAFTGCVCCRKSRRANRESTISLICFVLSWLTTVIAFTLLVAGAVINSHRDEASMHSGSYYCYTVKPGVFAGAATLCLATTILGIVSYYFLIKSELNPASGSSVSFWSFISRGKPKTVTASSRPAFPYENMK